MTFVSPDQWRAAGDTFEWRGVRVFYRVEGSGEPLLLVHGFPTASWDWWRVWPALVARYRVLALDMVGFGFTDKPRWFAYSIFAQADLFEALLARERVTHYRLLAHDYGDTVAQELLARQRSATGARIRAACLLNGGLFPETHRALLVQKLLASPLGPLLARASTYRSFAASMRKIWGTNPVTDDELHGMWQLASGNDGMAVMPKLIGYMAERRHHRERWVRPLVEPPCPIRLVNGLADPISGAHMVARYRDVVSAPDVIELAGIGHYPQLEAPDAVVDAVLALFERAAA
jgi:pimeloyl-ACP methyl ester carboxylesterase